MHYCAKVDNNKFYPIKVQYSFVQNNVNKK